MYNKDPINTVLTDDFKAKAKILKEFLLSLPQKQESNQN